MEVDAPTPTPTPRESTYTSTESQHVMPKANPPVCPGGIWTAAPTESAAYPRVSTYDFQLSAMKKVDRNLDVYYAGILDPTSNRRWAFTLATPTCYVSFASVAFEGEPKNSRVILSPHFGTNSIGSPDSSLFQEFMEHVEGISYRFKVMLQNFFNRDVSQWQSPFKTENGFIVGMQAKVKNDNVRQLILTGNGSLKCTLKLTCVYFAKGRSGLSFELVEAHEA